MGKIAFIGLGVMGGPMARHLAAAGHELTVYNRTPAKAERLIAFGAIVHPTAAHAVAEACGLSFETVAAQTADNTRRLFGFSA